MSNIEITLPDGSKQSVAAETRPIDIAKSISPRLADAAIAAKVNGEMFDLTRPIGQDATLQIKFHLQEYFLTCSVRPNPE